MGSFSKTTNQSMKKVLTFLAPLLLIGAAIQLTSHFMKGAGGKLEIGKTYELWLQEAEVGPVGRNGEKWDFDGSAPDLKGIMSWQDQIVLKTVEASDGLIARWGETAVNAAQALKGEADSHSLQRVGRFRMENEGAIEVVILDGDLGATEFAGGFRIPLSSLRLGINRVNGSGTLRSLAFKVSSSEAGGDAEASSEEWKLTVGVQELNELPVAMRNRSEQSLDEAGKALNRLAEGLSNELIKQGEVLGEEIEKGVNEIIREIETK
jgi:hypothetical protein